MVLAFQDSEALDDSSFLVKQIQKDDSEYTRHLVAPFLFISNTTFLTDLSAPTHLEVDSTYDLCHKYREQRSHDSGGQDKRGSYCPGYHPPIITAPWEGGLCRNEEWVEGG